MRKKILHIISSVTWRGGEQQVSFMLNPNSNLYEYFLFCPENAAIIQRNTHLKSNLFTYKKKMGFDILGAIHLTKICIEQQIDLLHVHDSHGINTFIIANFLGLSIPVVVHRHVNFPVKNRRKYMHNNIKKIICVGEEVKRKMSSIVDKNKLIVIHPGIQLSDFAKELDINNSIKPALGIPVNHKIIGMVSAFEKEKNIEEFIRIANSFIPSNPDCHFIIVGDGSLYTSYSSVYASSQIHFLGFRNDIPQILSELDIFLFTSKNEGLPLVLLEAMASKIPIVSSQFASVKELVKDGESGFIYSNIEDAIQKIDLLLKNPNIYVTPVEKAYESVKLFDITLINKEIEKVYTSVLHL